MEKDSFPISFWKLNFSSIIKRFFQFYFERLNQQNFDCFTYESKTVYKIKNNQTI